jgi:hypothetical protein
MREERRRSWRFPVLEEQRAAELRVGDEALTVRLKDQSATGFLIECDRHPGVYAGENVWLQTSSGWTEVKVIKIRHEIDGTHIGLERLGDVNVEAPSSTGVIRGDALAHEAPHNSPWPTIIMIASLLGVMGFLAWTAYQRYLAEHSGPGRSAAAISIEHQAQHQHQKLQKSVQEFGVALLMMPQVVERLALSQDQQVELRRIFSQVAASEQQLQPSGLAADELAKQLAALHQQATEQALDLLTPAQSQAWQAMYTEALEQLEQRSTSSSSANR